MLDKVKQSPDDWDARTFLTVPGPVWTVSSDTCMTGRPSAPNNIAYDDFGREFVYRQPADESELAGIMSADSEEVFACYRFDGLERWTLSALNPWLEDHSIIIGWLRTFLATEAHGEIRDSLNAYHEYLTGDEFRMYVIDLRALLSNKSEPVASNRRSRKSRNLRWAKHHSRRLSALEALS